MSKKQKTDERLDRIIELLEKLVEQGKPNGYITRTDINVQPAPRTFPGALPQWPGTYTVTNKDGSVGFL